MKQNHTFIPTTIDQISPTLLSRVSTFPALIDGFLIDHIYDSNHYWILVDDHEVGYCSIHGGSLLTQFYLAPQWSRLSQAVFAQVKKLEQVQTAFVPTCDTYFLSHTLDEFRYIEKQAYFFQYDPQSPEIQIVSQFYCRLAVASELGFIKHQSGDFFSDAELLAQIARKEIWLSYYGDQCVGFGLIVRSKLFPDVADLGMYTCEDYRQKGYGKLTIQFLIKVCLQMDLRIAAGCWYYNHNSKKTLERAGLYSTTRLLKVYF